MTLNGVVLHPREADVVRLVAEGMLDKEIAHALGLTEGTIKAYLSATIYRKLGLSRAGNPRVKLARMVWQESSPVGKLQAMATEANRIIHP